MTTATSKLAYLLQVDVSTLYRWQRLNNAPQAARLACLSLQRQGEIEDIPEWLQVMK